MLSNRQSFETGFRVTWSSRYFGGIELLSPFIYFPDLGFRAKLALELDQIRGYKEVVEDDMEKVGDAARQLGLIILAPPRFPEAYYAWSKMCEQEFSGDFHKSSANYIALQFGLRTGEIMGQLKVLNNLLQVSLSIMQVPAFELQWQAISGRIVRAAKQLLGPALQSQNVGLFMTNLHDGMYVPLSQAAYELGQAKVAFGDSNYLQHLSEKITEHLEKLHQAREIVLLTL